MRVNGLWKQNLCNWQNMQIVSVNYWIIISRLLVFLYKVILFGLKLLNFPTGNSLSC